MDSIFKKNVDSKQFIFQKHFFGNNEGNIAVAIGNLFDSTVKSAVLVASKNDSIYTVRIFRKSESWNEIFNFDYKHNYISSIDEILDFIDIDFDGVKDLVIINDYIEIRASSIYSAWLYKKDKLKFVENFEQYPNFEIDNSSKRILSYIACGCADYCMAYQIGVIKNYKITTEYSIFLDCCETKNKGCSVKINNGKSFNVKRFEVYKQVPKKYQEILKQKMQR